MDYAEEEPELTKGSIATTRTMNSIQMNHSLRNEPKEVALASPGPEVIIESSEPLPEMYYYKLVQVPSPPPSRKVHGNLLEMPPSE